MNKPTPEQLEEIKTGLFSDEAPKPPALKANNNDRKGCNVVPKEQIKPAKVTEGDDGNVQIETDHALMGVESQTAQQWMLTQAAVADGKSETLGRRVQKVAAIADSIAPQDAVEGMLVTQMIAAHNMAMDCAMRASSECQTFEGRDMNMRHATRLMNAFANAAATLDKHRGKGQTIVVKHQQVNVGEGGQAIVGDVHHGEVGKNE